MSDLFDSDVWVGNCCINASWNPPEVLHWVIKSKKYQLCNLSTNATKIPIDCLLCSNVLQHMHTSEKWETRTNKMSTYNLNML